MANSLVSSTCQVSQAMSKNFVKVSPTAVLKDVIRFMHDKQQNCVLVVDAEDFLEGILTRGDIQRRGVEVSRENLQNRKDSTVYDVCYLLCFLLFVHCISDFLLIIKCE